MLASLFHSGLETGEAADLLVLDRDPLGDMTVAGDPTARALGLRAGWPAGGTRRLVRRDWVAVSRRRRRYAAWTRDLT